MCQRAPDRTRKLSGLLRSEKPLLAFILNHDGQSGRVEESQFKAEVTELRHNVLVHGPLLQDVRAVVFIYVDWSAMVLKLSPHLVRFMDHQVPSLEFMEIDDN